MVFSLSQPDAVRPSSGRIRGHANLVTMPALTLAAAPITIAVLVLVPAVFVQRGGPITGHPVQCFGDAGKRARRFLDLATPGPGA